MESKSVPAIFEDGKLRPLSPLDLDEQERVEVVIVRATGTNSAAEDEYVPAITDDANPAVTLEQVQQPLANIPASLADDFHRERDERF